MRATLEQVLETLVKDDKIANILHCRRQGYPSRISRKGKLGPGIGVGLFGSLDVPGTSQNESGTNLAIPKTIKGFPGGFSAPKTRPTGPGTI
jgi:hypothetical protein